MKTRRLLALALLAQAIWLGGIVLAPYLASRGHDDMAGRLYDAYRPFCHQMAERSLMVFGEKMAVCARCFGIYAGALAGTFVFIVAAAVGKGRGTVSIPAVLVALAPLAVDGVSQLLGLRESGTTLRLATGLLFGSAVAYYVVDRVLSRMEEPS